MQDLKLAVLIDADNISPKYVKVILDEAASFGVAACKRIYGDWSDARLKSWKDVLLNNSIIPIQQYSYTTGKNATDSAMIIDAMDLLYAGNVDGFCIVSSDSDFTRLAARLREAGKLVIGLALCLVLLHRGADSSLCAAGAIAGVTAGSLLSLTVLTVFLLRRRDRAAVDVPPARSAVLRELLTAGIPITLGAAGMSLITLLDQALVMSTLQNTLGYTEAAATALYGEYTFGMTLFALPPSFIYPVTVSLVPDISAALARGDRPAAGRSAAAALKLTTLIALPTGAGLSVLAGPILRLLYPAVPDTAAAAAYHLTILGIACIFVCLMVATNGVLQAYGKEYIPVVTLLCGGILKIITNYLMVGDPATNVRGAPVSTLYCYGLIVVLNLIAIARCVPERPSYLRLFARPVLITAVMALAARSSYGLLARSLPERWAVLPAIAVAVVVYGVLVLALGAVTRQDVLDLPKGEKIARMLHLH